MNKRGFTLSEMMVATGIMTISMLVLSTLSVLAYQQYAFVTAKMEATTEADRLQYLFVTIFGQAVDITGSADLSSLGASPYVLNTYSQTNLGNGYTQNVTYTTTAATPAWTTLALFLRESGGLSGSAGSQGYGGTLQQTGVFYRRPEPAVGATISTSGIVFFNLGLSGGAMTPTYADVFVGRVTSLTIQRNSQSVNSFDPVTPTNTYTENRATALNVQYTIRYHYGAPGSQTWCPSSDVTALVAGCTGAMNFADIQRTFQVQLVNNVMKHRGLMGQNVNAAPYTETRTQGNLYFFHLLNPLLGI